MFHKFYIVLALFLLLPMAFPLGGNDDSMILVTIPQNHPEKDTLIPFEMDRFEVTNAEFFQCIQAKVCTHTSVFKKLVKALPQHPVAGVRWIDAQQYCHWKNKRLPTEKEWELVATHGGSFPWGEEKITEEFANFCDVNCLTAWSERSQNDYYEKTAPVGSFPKGNTKNGITDLMGNVWEWTSTVFSTGKEFLKKNSAMTREDYELEMTVKGGSYGSPIEQLEPRVRAKASITYRSNFIGFRCVK